MLPLEKELETDLLALYERWKAVARPKNYFLQMVRKTRNTKRYKGPVGTVRYLLMAVEALILQPEWKPLFGEWELQKATARLKAAKSN